MTRDEVIALVVEKAHEHDIEPYELLGGAIAESELDPNAARYGVWPDVSFGLMQQTVKFADEGDQSDSTENIDLIRRLYSDPAHALDVAAEKYRYWRHNPDVPALTAWIAYNGPSYYYTPEESPNRENYRRALAEAQAILGGGTVVTGNRLYGPDIPTSEIQQLNDWSCAVRSLYGALLAMAALGQGERVTYGDGGSRDVYEWLVPIYDDASVGLHHADGSDLVTILKQHGYKSDRKTGCSLSDVQSRAGLQPVLLGMQNWGPAGHWVYVRGLEFDGTLILENPAGNYRGIGEQLRDSFARLGPATMVWIDRPSTTPAPSTTADPRDGRIADLEMQVTSLKAALDDERRKLGYVTHEVASAIQAAVNTLVQQTPGS